MSESGDDAQRRLRLERADELLAPSADSHVPVLPTRPSIAGYRFIRRLGQGGMGVVWHAEDLALRRQVAIKLLAPHMTFDAEADWRLRQEGAATARLDHPAIVAVHAAAEAGEQRYLVMELVDGVPLHRLLLRLAGVRPDEVTLGLVAALLDEESPGMGAALRAGPRPPSTFHQAAADWAAQVASALAHAHQRGVLHRDIKPSNLIFDRQGRIRVVDFGLARIEDQAPVTRTEAVLGTLAYVAPEVLMRGARSAEARSDIYSLGVALYELLALRPPFTGDTYTMLRRVPVEPAPPLRDLVKSVPQDLGWIVQTCLSKEPQGRYAAAQDLAEDLQRFVAGEPVRARPPRLSVVMRSLLRRHPFAASALGLAAALLVAAFPLLGWIDAAAARRDAAAERDAVDARLRDHARLRAQLDAEVAVLRGERGVYSSSGSAGRSAAAERRLRALRFEMAAALEQARGSAERAARIEGGRGGVSAATRRALARFHFYRFELAREAGNEAEASLARAALLENDVEGAYEAILVERGSLHIDVEPQDAEIYLFRYEQFHELRPGEFVEPRLVPVPWSPAGRWVPPEEAEGFVPGEPSLVVLSVAGGSPAARAGIAAGDLVIRINGHGCGRLFSGTVAPESDASRVGIPAWAPLVEIDDIAVENEIDWAGEVSRQVTGVSILVVGSHRLKLPAGEWDRVLPGIAPTAPPALLRLPAPAKGAEILLLRRGQAHRLRLGAGEVSGIECSLTSYPLVLGVSNRISPGPLPPMEPGSLLVVARRSGCEQLRYPVVLPRNGTVHVKLDLLPEGSTPPGFVWIPPGKSVIEGDPEGLRPGLEQAVTGEATLPGFFIRATEMTTAEWFEFLDDPVIARTARDSLATGWTVLLPRHFETGQRQQFRIGADGKFEPLYPGNSPILGISAEDIALYLGWRASRDRARGLKWLWAMPTLMQWQRAARGADGRIYPWGNDYYPASALCHHSGYRHRLLPQAGPRLVPGDESPFGVFDMAGSRREWTTSGLCGTSWGDGERRQVRTTYVEGVAAGYFNWTCGFRPVLVPNPDIP